MTPDRIEVMNPVERKWWLNRLQKQYKLEKEAMSADK